MDDHGSDRDIPVELRLVDEVKGCRTCKFFWGEVPAYGPYPAWDFKERYPEAVRRHLPQTTSTAPIRWLEARAAGSHQVEPAMMQGCRKAPIMTIGINPNLTSFFQSADSATWAYPNFAEAASYAYAHRHGSVFQTSLTRADVADHLLPDGRILARADGTLDKVERLNAHRWMAITLEYGDVKETVEVSWSPDRRAVIVAGRSFKAGDVICGYVDASVPTGDADITLYARGSGYNQRFLEVLWRFQALVGGPLADARLEIGEDVGQNDMIACASPGWTGRYDIPTARVAHNCVKEHAYVFRQLLQTRPAVLVLVSASALAMFSEHLPAGLHLDLDRERDGRERDDKDLLRETTSRRCLLTVDHAGVRFTTRVIVSPHFSYADNFAPQAPFPVDQWVDYQVDHPADTRVLVGAGRVEFDYDKTHALVRFSGADDPLAAQLTPAGLKPLLERHMAAFDMMAGALAEEFRSGVLAFDARRGHLVRSDGPCSFCVNDRWQFPEGCAYDKCGPNAASPAKPVDAAPPAPTPTSTPTDAAPPADAVRVWLGYRNAAATPEKFVRDLGATFIPITAQMMEPLGLRAYLPAVLASDPEPIVPAEIALVFYASQAAYRAASQQTVGGRGYGLMHAAVFDLDPAGPPPISSSGFPALLHDRCDDRTPYHLYTDPVAWRGGHVSVFVGVFTGPAATLRAAVVQLGQRLQAARPAGLEGMIFVVSDTCLICWQRWRSPADRVPLELAVPLRVVLDVVAAPLVVPRSMQAPDPADGTYPATPAEARDRYVGRAFDVTLAPT